MMKLRFHTVDVFTRTRFGGNPLAVVLDADGLTGEEMQMIAREFNYSETSFVLRPKDNRHTAHVRIFTPTVEVPFAGHPNVGTAYVLAAMEETGLAEEFVFEEAAGLVRASLEGGMPRPFQVAQGIDMQRPSLLSVHIVDRETVRIGGACVPVMSGTLMVSTVLIVASPTAPPRLRVRL
jgi:predicted PhzF superfamily epimerase YddE/YHI9